MFTKNRRDEIKKVLLIVLFLCLFSGWVHGDYFEKGRSYITGQIDWSVVSRPFSKPFGFSYGYGLSKRIEVGATFIMHFFLGAQDYTFSGDLFWHFSNLKKPMVLFAGFSAGYDYYIFPSDDWAGLPSSKETFIFPVLGARFFFKNKFALSLRYARSYSKYLSSKLFFGVTMVL